MGGILRFGLKGRFCQPRARIAGCGVSMRRRAIALPRQPSPLSTNYVAS